MKKEFRVEVIKEGALGTLLFGASRLPVSKIEEVMNKYGEQGWDVSFQVIEQHRMLFLWKREALVITFVRDLKNKKTKKELEKSEEVSEEIINIERIKRTVLPDELIVKIKRNGKIEKMKKADWDEIVKIGNEDKFEIKFKNN